MKSKEEITAEITKNHPCVFSSIQSIMEHYAYEGYKLGKEPTALAYMFRLDEFEYEFGDNMGIPGTDYIKITRKSAIRNPTDSSTG